MMTGNYKTHVLVLMTILMVSFSAFAILNTSSIYAKDGLDSKEHYVWVVDSPEYFISYTEYVEMECARCRETFEYELDYVEEALLYGDTVYGSGESYPGPVEDGFNDSGTFYCVTPVDFIEDVDGNLLPIPEEISEHFLAYEEGEEGCIPEIMCINWNTIHEDLGHWEVISSVKLIQAKTKPVEGNKTQIILKIKSSPKKLSYYQVKLWRKNWQKTYNVGKKYLKGGKLYSFGSLKEGKYKIKVRAVKKVNGIEYYGPWSNVRTITSCNPGEVKLVRAKTKAVKGNKTQIILKIKSSPKKLSYYQVKLWRKNWQKTYNVSKKYLKGRKLYSFGSLKKGKYKIKVRAVKKVNGVKFYGPWSNVKKIKGR